MTEREKIIKVIDEWANKAVKANKFDGASVYNPHNAAELADALIAAGIGDVSELKKHRVVVEKSLIPEDDNAYVLPNIPPTVKQLYSGEEVEQIVKEREEYKHRAEVAERALKKLASFFAHNAKFLKYEREKERYQKTIFDDWINQAEEELAEEGKDENY